MTDKLEHANPYNMPAHFKLWFGGNYAPIDWNKQKVWYRGGFIGSLNSKSLSYWEHDGSELDIVGYVSTDTKYDLTHEEQYIVEQMALGAYIGYQTRYDINPPVDIEQDYEDGIPTVRSATEEWPHNAGTHLGSEGFRYSALIAYRQIRDHLGFMAWRGGRSTPFNTQ